MRERMVVVIAFRFIFQFLRKHIYSAGSQFAAKASGLSYIYLCSIVTKMA